MKRASGSWRGLLPPHGPATPGSVHVGVDKGLAKLPPPRVSLTSAGTSSVPLEPEIGGRLLYDYASTAYGERPLTGSLPLAWEERGSL